MASVVAINAFIGSSRGLRPSLAHASVIEAATTLLRRPADRKDRFSMEPIAYRYPARTPGDVEPRSPLSPDSGRLWTREPLGIGGLRSTFSFSGSKPAQPARACSRSSPMFRRIVLIPATLIVMIFAVVSVSALTGAGDDGIIRVKSAYSVTESVARIRRDIAGKGIMFFSEFDQSKLAAGAGITRRPSTLLTFGNPPLGTQVHHVESDCGTGLAGAAARVREREGRGLGGVYRFCLDRPPPRIKDRDAQFKMASSTV